MELTGKKIAFLGDSITEGAGVADVKDTYWNLVGRLTGAECHGYGIGGTRIAPQLQPSVEPRWDRYFASRVDEMIPDPDIVVVFGGTNDFGHGDAPFGTMDDRTESSFCGAFHVLLQKLIRKYPAAQIVVMTPLHRSSEDETGLNEFGVRRQCNLEGYVDAITAISGFYGIPVLDLFRTSGLQPRVDTLMERYMPDGLHPNEAGAERIAKKLIGFLGTL